MIKINVAGKLFVAGEYAVVQPGHEGLVLAIETGFSVEASPSEGPSILTTNQALPDLEFKLGALPQAEKPWHFALIALRLLALPADKEIHIHIESDLGLGQEKKGYGSSASVVVGVIQAADQFFNLNLSPDEVFDVARAAHQEAQGSGSGGDVAAIVYGGLVRYKNPDQIVRWDRKFLPYQTYVARTNQAVRTHDKLELHLERDFYQESDRLIHEILKTRHFSEFKQALLRSQNLLLDTLPQGYATEKLALALDLVNVHPYLAGKISGSGFGENLLVFADGVSQDEIQILTRTLAEAGIILEEVRIKW